MKAWTSNYSNDSLPHSCRSRKDSSDCLTSPLAVSHSFSSSTQLSISETDHPLLHENLILSIQRWGDASGIKFPAFLSIRTIQRR